MFQRKLRRVSKNRLYSPFFSDSFFFASMVVAKQRDELTLQPSLQKFNTMANDGDGLACLLPAQSDAECVANRDDKGGRVRNTRLFFLRFYH